MKAIHILESKQFQFGKYRRKSPKFGESGITYGTKGERKHRNNHKNRRKIDKIIASNEVNVSHPVMVRSLLKQIVKN